MKDTITNIRESLGLNKTEFAAALGVGSPLVTLWENGQRQPGKGKIRELLALALPRDQAALLQALLGDDNFDVLVFEDGGAGGVKLIRLPAQEGTGARRR